MHIVIDLCRWCGCGEVQKTTMDTNVFVSSKIDHGLYTTIFADEDKDKREKSKANNTVKLTSI